MNGPYYLIGIKGVAMTALTQLLLDLGESVRGSDVSEDFVTAPLLKQTAVVIDDFAAPIPSETKTVIYTAAHNAVAHPQVQTALKKQLTVLSHAEALGNVFNAKHGIAVCGVGGKSTVSAMISWILSKLDIHPSYAVGVGDIIGLNRTGRWDGAGEFFVAEADEYCTNPKGVQNGERMLPRFHYLHPRLTVANKIAFDHPDVYRDEVHTRAVFSEWFERMEEGSVLLSSDANYEWLSALPLRAHKQWFGSDPKSEYKLQTYAVRDQSAVVQWSHRGAPAEFSLRVPGRYNSFNAIAALAAVDQLGVDSADAAAALASFASTKRRFERVGSWRGAELYDDYAHHPSEITAVLEAANEWFPDRKIVVAFQPHTFSRTKSLFSEFVQALAAAPHLCLLDIFASARESYDPSVSSAQLAAAIRAENTQGQVTHLSSISDLAAHSVKALRPGDVLLTLGAGDIYKVHDLLQKE